MRVTIIGGGILGTAHAARRSSRGHEVVHLEREAEARGATVRNFGLVWVSGRADHELDDRPALPRTVGATSAPACPASGFRARRLADAAAHPEEVAVAEEVVARADADRPRLRPARPRPGPSPSTPPCAGKFLAGLHCSRDAAVESRRRCPPSGATSRTRPLHLPGRHRGPRGRRRPACLRDDHGRTLRRRPGHRLPRRCPGGLIRELAGELPVRRVRLQMMQTDPLDERAHHRHRRRRQLPLLPRLRGHRPRRPADRRAAGRRSPTTHRMQLLCVQRLHGGLTIGDTHEYDEPFAFDVDEEPYEHLTAVVEELLGRPLPADRALGRRLRPVPDPGRARPPRPARRRRLGGHRPRRPRHDPRPAHRRTTADQLGL